jgi:nitrate reductase beta subunit
VLRARGDGAYQRRINLRAAHTKTSRQPSAMTGSAIDAMYRLLAIAKYDHAM